MISIEAHRAAIGRFSGKAKSLSLPGTLEKNQFIDVVFFIFLVKLWLITLYGLVLTIVHQYFYYITFFVMVTLIYCYSMWIFKQTSDILCTTVEKMTRINELMRAPSPSKAIKDSPLTPCNYLDTYVLDGRSKHLDTCVLDDGYWSGTTIRIDCTKLIISIKNCIQVCLNYTCIVFICTSCMYIGIHTLCRMINAFCGLHDLESYSVSFLKRSQLLIAGDVESNPGPVDNNMVTPKSKGGRPKKSKGFNFMKPKKLDFDVETGNLDFNSNVTSVSSVNHNLINKISIIQSDILKVKCDAIVNAAKHDLLGGGGIDGAIHKKAGVELWKKCRDLPVKGKDRNGDDIRCNTGECEVTDTKNTNNDFKNRFTYVFHTVGPDCRVEHDMNLNAANLKNCYESVLQKVLDKHVKTIAFCCISTGVYEYPKKAAAKIAFETVTSWLERNHSSVEKIIFCTLFKDDYDEYSHLLNTYKSKNSNIVNEPTITTNDVNIVADTEIAGSSSSMDVDINHSLLTRGDFNRKCPVKLENDGVNVCFFNSIVQVLYSFSSFHDYLAQTSVSNTVIETIKDLFQTMNFANGVVTTFPYLNQLQLNHYQFRMQYDAEEALRFMIEKCYPNYSESNFGVTIDESFECEERLGGCKRKYNKPESHRILKLQIKETSDVQTVQHLLEANINYHLPEDYRCQLTEDEGCLSIGTVSKESVVTEVKDILVIQLKIFSHDSLGNERKFLPSIVINEHISHFDNFTLEGIIWHHGENVNNGHYTAMVKHSDTWYHTNDSAIDRSSVKFSCNAGEYMVPYLLFYKRNNSAKLTPSALTDSSLSDLEAIPSDSNPVCSKQPKIHQSPEKVNQNDEMNSITPSEGQNLDFSEVIDFVMHTPVKKTKYNFDKRKTKFSDKRLETYRLSKQQYRATDEGMEKQHEIDQKAKMKFRSTDDGMKKQHGIDQKAKMKLRSTEDGRMCNIKTAQKTRDAKKANKKEELETSVFPPEIDGTFEEHTRKCISDYINATSPSSLKTYECGVCGEGVKKDDYERIDIKNIPGRDLLEHLDEDDLEEYIYDGLLLSPGGINENKRRKSVNCCSNCLKYLRKEKLPPLSIANNFTR